MRRAIVAVAAGFLLAATGISGAVAQEDEDEGDYAPTSGGGDWVEFDLNIPGLVDGEVGPVDSGIGQPGDPGVDLGETGGTDAPPPASRPARTSTGSVPPGGTVEVTAPADAGAPSFLDGSVPSVGVVAGSGGTPAVFDATMTTDALGNVIVSITLPPATPTGVYYVFITGTNAAGEVVTYVADVTVSPAVARSAGKTVVSDAKVVRFERYEGPVPGAVAALYITPAQEDEFVEAVVEDGADLRIEGTELVVHRPSDDLDGGRPILAAIIVATVGGSLAAVRRRPVARKAVAR